MLIDSMVILCVYALLMLLFYYVYVYIYYQVIMNAIYFQI